MLNAYEGTHISKQQRLDWTQSISKPQNRRALHSSLGVCLLITVLLVAGAGAQTSAQATSASSPTACQFLSAPGAIPAFCETFDQPAGTGNRSGDLNGTLWGVSRLLGGVNSGQGQYYDASPTIMEKCGQSIQVQPPNDIAICNGQLVDAQFDQHGVTTVAMYPKQPFDIAGRTGTVAFDVSDDSHGSHRAWPEFWYTNKPVPAPFTHFSSLQQVPQDGFGVRFDAFCPAFGDPGCGIRPACPEYPISVSVISVGSADVVNNYASNDSSMDTPPGPISVEVVGCVKASSGPGDMNHFELRISPNEIDVYGVDAGATGPLKKIAVITNMTLTLTRGLVWLEDAHYNGDKDGIDQGTHTFTWDNLAFDGPVLPRDLAFDVLDRLTPVGPNYPGLLNLGWPLVPNDPTPLTLTVPGVYNIDKAAGAILTLNYATDLPITLSYRVNNGVWHDQPWPFPTCYTQNGNVQCGSRTIAVPVPLSEVQPGTNTIQFKTSDSTNNAGIANVDLILVGAGGIVCTLNCPTTTTVTSSENPSNFGDAVTFTATVTSGSGAIPFGSVTFYDSTTALSTGMLNASGVATFTTSLLAIGNHTITAVYAGNTSFTGSTGSLNTNPQVVNQAISTTAVATSVNPSVSGQSVTFTATVAAVDQGLAVPTGTITFKDGASTLGTSMLNGSGQTTFAISSLTVGTHSITAAYGGDTIFLPSASSSFTQVVIATGNGTSTTLTVNGGSPNPIYFGFAKGIRQNAGFVVNVTGSTDGDSVLLMEGNQQIGPALSLTGGQVSYTTQFSVGQHSVRAIYLGNGIAAGSVSSSVAVNRSPRPKPR